MKTHFYPTRKRHGPAAMLTAVLVALMQAPAFGQAPIFGPPQEDYFEVGLAPHFPEELAIMFPTLADIDNDGDLDLFVSDQWNYGSSGFAASSLDFYRNEGDSECPEFQKEGQLFGIPEDAVMLKFIDINDDGLPDVFGFYRGNSPSSFCILNSGTETAPMFEIENINYLPYGLNPAGIAFYTPVFSDLDGDGDFDAFNTGRTGGHFLYQENIGTSEAPEFNARLEDPFGLSLPYAPQGPIFPALADYDCDGDIDIINTLYNIDIGFYDYDAYFHENKYDELGYTHFEPGVFIGPAFVVTQGDLDGDGDLDAMAFEHYSRNISAFCVMFPEAAFSYDYTEDGLQYAFTNESTGQSTECNPVQWLWDFGDGATSEEENPIHVYAEGGTYDVCLTVTDIAGSDTYCAVITKSTQQYRHDGILLYPNPARDYLYLRFEDGIPANTARVEVFDSWGRLFKKVQLGYPSPTQPERINVAGLPEGLYLVKVAVGEQFYIGDFVKMR